MHLYDQKRASSSKLTGLSRVPPLQLGICLSGLALFTGCFLLVCSSLGGRSEGVFCGVGVWKREFLWVLFWILVNKKAGNLPACYSVILKHDTNCLNLEHRRCWKIFLRRSWNIEACLQGRTCFSQKNHPVDNRSVLASPLHPWSLKSLPKVSQSKGSQYAVKKKLHCVLSSQGSMKRTMLECGPSLESHFYICRHLGAWAARVSYVCIVHSVFLFAICLNMPEHMCPV